MRAYKAIGLQYYNIRPQQAAPYVNLSYTRVKYRVNNEQPLGRLSSETVIKFKVDCCRVIRVSLGRLSNETVIKFKVDCCRVIRVPPPGGGPPQSGPGVNIHLPPVSL